MFETSSPAWGPALQGSTKSALLAPKDNHEGGKVKWGMVEVGSRMGLGEVFWAA